ncbi:hypothetical protein N9233_01880, partial [Flavobacteriales bacterium]|nr:hypothetical protein [Flavobacteriales bacterium]
MFLMTTAWPFSPAWLNVARFDEARLAGNRAVAVAAFEKAKTYQTKVERLGIGLLILGDTEAAYNRV